PVADYMEALLEEISTVGDLVPPDCRTVHMHWGGGSPSILLPDDIRRLADALATRFNFADDAEIAVEVDPRHVDADRVAAFVAAGFNRVSVGVQDFNPEVQRAINREQSLGMTRAVVDMFRAAGVSSVN